MKRMPTNIPPPSIIDEQNIFHVVPLMERVKFGAKMAEMEERKVEANAKAEVKQDNCRESSNEANSAGDFV